MPVSAQVYDSATSAEAGELGTRPGSLPLRLQMESSASSQPSDLLITRRLALKRSLMPEVTKAGAGSRSQPVGAASSKTSVTTKTGIAKGDPSGGFTCHMPASAAVAQATAATAFLLTDSRAGFGRRALVSPAGMSAVRAASSMHVRDASAWPTRRSNSSLSSRPCTNAALSTSTTRSRSACDARRWPRPTALAAFSSPGPAVTDTHPTGRMLKA